MLFRKIQLALVAEQVLNIPQGCQTIQYLFTYGMFNPRQISTLACTQMLSLALMLSCYQRAIGGETDVTSPTPIANNQLASTETYHFGAGDGEGGSRDKAQKADKDAADTNSVAPAEKKSFKDKMPLIGSGNVPKATVKIPFQGKEVELLIELKKDGMMAGFHEQAKAAVSDMQIEDYTNAVSELIVAVNEKPKNESYHFALAVAMEMTGNYAGARTNYAAANRLAGGAGSPQAQTALKRLDARTK